MPPRSRVLAPTMALMVGVVLGSCSESASQLTPEEALAAAKQHFDETSGVRVLLSTDRLPPGVNGVLRAEGVGTHAPAFDGSLEVIAGGLNAQAAVVSVDGVVHAKLPFDTKFVQINPAHYAAPDPADLMRPDRGISSLLTAAEGVEESGEVRDGEQVVTEYTATVPGNIVASIIPSASADSDFDATFALSESQVLAEVVLGGPFYPDADEVTYRLELDDYGVSADITAP